MLRKALGLWVVLAISGCATFQPPSEPDIVEPPVPVVIEQPPIDEIETSPLARVPLPPLLPRVAILLTNTQPAYADVAAELATRLKKYDVYDLEAEGAAPISILRRINDSNTGAVVAIGLRAARSAVAMSEKPVVFSQVFNYQDHDLLKGHSRGVAAVPPLAAQLEAWKNIDSTIARIGAIIGEGHDELIVDAQAAAEQLGIELRVQVTRSDQETLYFFRRMIRDIDGFWLFPDNRVLSGRVLQQMLAEASHQQVPVAVPSDSMLQLGAMVSMTTVAADIAETIVAVIRRIQSGQLDSVPPITQLSEIRVTTNNAAQVVRE